MKCISPLRLKHTWKDDLGIHRSKFVDVPCGKCLACLSNRKKDWVFRLKQEWKQSANPYFVTLTYDNEHLPLSSKGCPTLCKSALQLFMKRLRSYTDNKLRFFAVGEYGSHTFRPHYHLLLFNCPPNIGEIVIKAWKFGFTQLGEVNEKSIAYVCKYVLAGGNSPTLFDFLKEYEAELPFMLCSRRPAIGSCFLTENMLNYLRDNPSLSVTIDGYRQTIPRYYRTKIYDDITLENLNYEIQQRCLEKDYREFDKDSQRYGEDRAIAIQEQKIIDFINQAKQNFKLNRSI